MFIERPDCPVCGNTELSTVCDLGYHEQPVKEYLLNYYRLKRSSQVKQYDVFTEDMRYILRSCDRCNLISQAHCPNEEFSALIYSEWMGLKAKEISPVRKINFKDSKHYMSEALKLVESALQQTGKRSPSDLKVLDFGMGFGGFAMALKACGCETYGYDFAEDRLSSGRDLGIKTLDPEEISESDFDFINTEQVFEHLPDPMNTANMLASSLRPGGVFKISVPFDRRIERGDFTIDWRAPRYARYSPIPNAPLEHLQYYRRPSLDHLGEALKLQRVRIPTRNHFQYSLEWFNPRNAVRKLGRAVALEQLRNYYLFSKVDAESA